MSNGEVRITDRPGEGCTILDISAENFTYPQTASLKNYVAHLLEAGERNFVLNVSEVRIVDSYGLATIVSVLKNVKEHGGGIALCGLNDMFNHLVKVTHLDRVLEIWPSEAQAAYCLANFNKSSTRH